MEKKEREEEGEKKRNATPANLFGKIYHSIAKRLKTKKEKKKEGRKKNETE